MERIRERDGVLYRLVYPPNAGAGVLQLLLPQSLQIEVRRALHDDQGHQGCERTLSLVRQRCYWPHLQSTVEKWCRECSRCAVAKAVVPKIRTFPGTLLASQPLEIVAIDFTVLERASDGRENVLVVTDVFQSSPRPTQPQTRRPKRWPAYSQRDGSTSMASPSVSTPIRAVVLKGSCCETFANCMEYKRAGPHRITLLETGSVNGSIVLYMTSSELFHRSKKGNGHIICPTYSLHTTPLHTPPPGIRLMN